MADSPRQMHLAIMIGGYGNQQEAWRRPQSRVEEMTSLSFFREMAGWAESARLDALFVADTIGLDISLLKAEANGHLEPLTLLAALSAVTDRIGLIASISTTFGAPYTVARQMASLDHLSGGRAAWNIVTSTGGEKNYGMQQLPGHDERYRIASEFVDATIALWDGWDDDARVIDRRNGVYVDRSKVRPTNFCGEYYRVEGPLNVPRPPQGRPVLVQAGSSGTGMAFAARIAEVVFTAQTETDKAQAFYADMKAQVRASGRDPDHCRILCGVNTIIGSTEAEALEVAQEINRLIDIELGVKRIEKKLGGIDLSGLDVDAPIPPRLVENLALVEGLRSRFEMYRKLVLEGQVTLRRMIELDMKTGHWAVLGSPVQVADQLQARFEAHGADGYMVMSSHLPESFRLFTDEVVPILAERGVFRTAYAGPTLRHHLGLPRPDLVIGRGRPANGGLLQ